MKKRYPMMFFASVWQVLRFCLIGYLTILVVNPFLSPGLSVFLLWPSVCQLLLASALLITAIYPSRMYSFRFLLIGGKVLDVLPAILLVVYQGVALRFRIVRPLFFRFDAPQMLLRFNVDVDLWFYYFLIAGLIVDLFFVFILLSYKPEQGIPETKANLPILDETYIEEE